MDLTKEFQKFIGKELREGNNPNGYAKDDPVMKEIFELAAKKGLKVRTILPGQIITMDYRTDRLNVNISPLAPKNTFGISGFRIG